MLTGRRRLGYALAVTATVLVVLAAVVAAVVVVRPTPPEGVRVVPDSSIVTVPGYERGCKPEQGCVFGPAWSDDVAVAGGRNGCDTRNDLLGQTLDNVQHRPGTRNCVVISGDFVDPYSGRRVRFTKQDAAQVHVDHVFALAAAWNRGAAAWTPQRRRDFANDPLNLVVTTASANQSKGDRPPARWLPEAAAGRCLFVSRFVEVAQRYQLPITAGDLRVIDRVQRGC
ncbi:MAG: HNH endonuclease [Micropruina sp.]|nr:HNH endonuclease [Micropruina sp.]